MKNLLTAIGAIFVSGLLFAQTSNHRPGNPADGAGQSLSSGDRNTMVGDSAGFNTNTGSHNIMIGHNAGISNTSGRANVFIGTAAGANHVNDHYNIAIGFKALGGNPYYSNGSGITDGDTGPRTFGATGDENIAIGYRAAEDITSGTDNVIIGDEAGRSMTTGIDNVVIGKDAGRAMLGADDNTFIGNAAGFSYTDGTGGGDNVFVGNEAGYNSSTSAENVFIGNTAGRFNTTGSKNTFVGNEAGYDTNTGSNNVFIGDSTGLDNGAGIGNTFVGQAAGPRNEHADYNTFMGYQAGFRTNVSNGTTNASRNTMLGAKAGWRNEEGSDNLVIGYGADFSTSLSDGSDFMTIIGTGALGTVGAIDENYGVVIGGGAIGRGSYNVAVGGLITEVNDYSVGIGYQVGVSAIRSIAIGSNSAANYTYAAALGSGAIVDTTNGFVVGGITAIDRMTLGIGTTKPNQKSSIDLAETDHGFLINRLTDPQETSLSALIGTTEEGMMIYNTTDDQVKVWDGTQWLSSGEQDLALAGNNLTITNNASPTTIDLSSYLDNTDAQDLSLAGNTLSLTNDATPVDLSAYLDNTNTQLNEAQVDAFVANNGYLTSFTEVDGSITNEIQDLSIAGNTLSLSSDATPVDLSAYLDNTDTQLNEAQVDAFVANNGYLTSFTEVDGSITNEIQDLSIAGNTLSLSSDATPVDLSGYLDNTDAQDLSIAGNTLSLTNDGTTVDLSGFLDNTDAQDLSLAGNTLSLTNDGTTVDLSGYVNTDAQNLSLTGTTLNIDNGTGVDLTSIITNTDDQFLSLVGTSLSIEDANTVDLSVFLDNTDQQNLTAATLTGNILQIDIQNGSSVSVDLSPMLASIEAQLADHETRIIELENCACDSLAGLWNNGGNTETETGILYQNIPNPFNNTSSIKYYIPSWATSANIVISNSMGQVISNNELKETGAYGKLFINAEGLSAGAYYYTLYINQTGVDTRTMVVE